MVTEERLTRAQSAVEELASGEMSVTPNGDGTFTVKDYEVDMGAAECECKDHEYRETFCKHLVACHLQSMWGNIDASEIETGDAVPPEPEVIDTLFENIPEQLQKSPQWVCWRQEIQENKDGTKRWTKVPLQPHTEEYASSTDPETWGTFAQAVGRFNGAGNADGIGFVLTEEDEFVGIDIDDCIVDGEMNDAVQALIRDLDTYGELSPSGTGVRLFVKGESMSGGCEGDLPGEAHVEMYTEARYLTVTGQRLDYLPMEVTEDEEAIRTFDALVG